MWHIISQHMGHTALRQVLHQTAAYAPLQDSIAQHHREQEQGLRELQGLVGAALAVPKEVVQPAFEALGKHHVVMLAEQLQLQLQLALVRAVTRCIGEACTSIVTTVHHQGCLYA